MAYPGRENVAVALFNLLNGAVTTAVGLNSSARGLRQWADVNRAQMPALYQFQKPEKVERTFNGLMGLPAVRTMYFEIWMYACGALEGSVLPDTQLNNMVDAVEDAMSPSPTTGLNTLSGLVATARINGNNDYWSLIRDGVSIAMIPIEVILP